MELKPLLFSFLLGFILQIKCNSDEDKDDELDSSDFAAIITYYLISIIIIVISLIFINKKI